MGAGRYSALPAAGALLALATRIVLAGLFFYSGLVKAGSSEAFLAALLPFTFLPLGVIEATALLLPWAEVLLAAGLLWTPTSRFAACGTVLLMLTFIAVIGWALSEGIIVSCGCFGEDEEPSAARMKFVIARDAVIAGVALWLALRGRPRA